MKMQSRTMKENLFQQILMERKQAAKCKTFLFTCIFINCHSIIESCQYLLLIDKISSKTKTIIISPQK